MCTVNIRGHEANFYEAEAEARCHKAEIEAEARKSEAEAEAEAEHPWDCVAHIAAYIRGL